MNVTGLTMHVIEMELKSPFVTHLETVKRRRGILIEVVDKEGLTGYGEAVAFTTPWYTEETVQTNFHIIKDVLFSLIAGRELSHPSEVNQWFEGVRGNRMAKAAVETAVWDLYSKRQEKPLADVLCGVRTAVPAGAVAAGASIAETVSKVESLAEQGYERIKVKISPANDLALLKEIRCHFPDIPLMADANSAYTLKEASRLKALDEFQLLMIEQPFAAEDIVEHAKLQRMIRTPVCLDESIRSAREAKQALELGSCGVINIKIGRVGGLQEAKQIHDLCQERGVPVWAGGMIEFGVSRAHNVALATLAGFSIPGDLSPSSHYWEEDVIAPEITVEKGRIAVSSQAGIGYNLNKRRLQQVTIHKEELTLK
ncbi:o-succinylbenzoate synthase [Bacillus xiapuensis]|uniref:o-succinylbenzoate synthase n=1 Tax=Bacillus xiapuensis TaxID=2014075 RepID=UPI000C2428C0|nr:o-succinylbenzoate synthase [Bacillus xiapuensis]